MKRLGIGSLLVFLVCLAAPGFQAQPKPGKLTKEEIAALQPGLALRFYADPAADKPLDARRVRLAALHVPADGAPAPLVPPGPFTARFSGYLKAPAKGAYSFRCAGTGTATVLLNGAEVLRTKDGVADAKTPGAAELARGYNRLDIVYTSPERGAATLRVSWQGDGFGLEPLQPETLFSRGDEADLVASQKLRDGRLSYATLGCARCHALPAKLTAAACAMPEFQQQAPSLEGVGSRLSTAWLAKWIAEPRSLRPTATMPQVLHGEPAQVQQQAADLAAYLASLEGPANAAEGKGTVADGRKTFERLACVGCHHLKDPKQEDAFGRQPLHFAAAKFKPGALHAFLRAPHAHYPWSRMPDFKLDAQEAGALTAFLNDQAKGTVPALAQPGNAERGAKLFRESGCASCHAAKKDEAAPAATRPAASAADKGCLGAGAAERGRAPDFGLSEATRAALRDFLATDGASLTRETPAEFAQRQVRVLQCSTCHRRDGTVNRLFDVLADEGDGSIPETLPALTWTGQKLKPHWTERLLQGQHDHRARPWLKLRMPAFPARADLLAAGLSHEHGYARDEDPRPEPDAKLAEVGKKLIVMQGGFNCVSCHGVGKQPAVAPFEAPGINLLDAAQRLRHDYYPRWMIDPTRVDLNTRMPKFSMDGTTTPLKDVLDGNAHRQFEAIWHYMATLPENDKP